VIELVDVSRTVTSGAGPLTILQPTSFSIDRGRAVAITGPSGSGKSTMLGLMAGLDTPTTGRILLDGTDITSLGEEELARLRGRLVGIVFQFFQLLPALTILENVVLPMDFCATWPVAERTERAMHLLEQVEMADQAHKLPGAVSGGQKQRAAIARALANDPPVIVADEPTGNLDTHTSGEVFDLFSHLVDRGKTLIMVTHSHSLSERVPRILEIRNGLVVRDERHPDAALDLSGPGVQPGEGEGGASNAGSIGKGVPAP